MSSFNELMHVAVRGFSNIEELLEAFFGFLCKQTDFYHTQLSEQELRHFGLDRSVNRRGFKPDHMRTLLARIFDKNLRLYRELHQPYLLGASAPQTQTATVPSVPRRDGSTSKDGNNDTVVASGRAAAKGSGVADSVIAVDKAGGSLEHTSERKIPDKEGKRPSQTSELSGLHRGGVDKDSDSGNGGDDDKSALPVVEGVDEAAADMLCTRFTLTTWNGGKTSIYCWTQTFTDITVELVSRQPLRASDVKLKATRDTLHLRLWDKRVLDGRLRFPIKVEDVMWSVEDKSRLVLSLEKVEELWWDCLLEGHPKIDVTQIESVKRFDEFSAPAQREMVKMMKQHREKPPTSGF